MAKVFFAVKVVVRQRRMGGRRVLGGNMYGKKKRESSFALFSIDAYQ